MYVCMYAIKYFSLWKSKNCKFPVNHRRQTPAPVVVASEHERFF